MAAVTLLLAACGSRSAPQPLRVAAASDLNFVLKEMAQRYPTPLEISFGSSGNFYTQIRNGAPFDVFLSADLDYARRLAATPDAAFPYAVGRLVVWVPDSSTLNPEMALRSAAVKHLAIANPQHAPYGRAAEAALRSMGLYETLRPKIVLGENIVQTLQFVESGAAEAGLVALSLARNRGRYWEVPPAMYPKVEQGGVILKDSAAARAFRDFLVAGEGRSMLKRYGFGLPRE